VTIDQVELLRAACCVAAAGGEVSPAEMIILRELVESAGVGETSFYAMIDRAANEPGYYKEQLDLLTGDAEAAITMLSRIATADGQISEEERSMLQHFAGKLGVAQKRFDEIVSAAT
jgi:tellurite resistance protein